MQIRELQRKVLTCRVMEVVPLEVENGAQCKKKISFQVKKTYFIKQSQGTILPILH